MIGWGASCPVFLVLFAEAKAEHHWYVLGLLGAYVYPLLMAWLTPRVTAPVALVMAGHGFESVMLAVFAEVACMDPVFVLVSLAVVVINAGVTRGRMGAAAVLLIYVATMLIVQEKLRAVTDIDPPVYVHVLLGVFLMGYLTIVSHQAYALVVRNATNKRKLISQKGRIDALHQHLVDTISNPFVSDEVVLGIIGPGLTPEQSRAYSERIRTRQRWEAIGRQTGRLAHDANNLMMPLMVMGDFLEERLVDDVDAMECLSDMETAVQRLHALHRQMSPRPTTREPSDAIAVLQHVVHEVVSLLESTSPESVVVTVTNELDEDLVYVPMDASGLHRCILNLGTNAIQAMQGGGRLTLRMRSASEAERARLDHPQGKAGVALCVEDTGSGIAPEVAERIFEPYFTTRSEDGGTGLGLSTTHALVSDAGGAVILQSTPNEGTTFTLVFSVAA